MMFYKCRKVGLGLSCVNQEAFKHHCLSFTEECLHEGHYSPKVLDSMQLSVFLINEFLVSQTGLVSEIGENVVSMFCFGFRLFCLI